MRDEQQRALFERSGEGTSEDPLVAFLYDLMRDHIPPGKIEGILRNCLPAQLTSFSNGYLALYAQDVATRIRAGRQHTGEAHEAV